MVNFIKGIRVPIAVIIMLCVTLNAQANNVGTDTDINIVVEILARELGICNPSNIYITQSDLGDSTLGVASGYSITLNTDTHFKRVFGEEWDIGKNITISHELVHVRQFEVAGDIHNQTDYMVNDMHVPPTTRFEAEAQAIAPLPIINANDIADVAGFIDDRFSDAGVLSGLGSMVRNGTGMMSAMTKSDIDGFGTEVYPRTPSGSLLSSTIGLATVAYDANGTIIRLVMCSGGVMIIDIDNFNQLPSSEVGALLVFMERAFQDVTDAGGLAEFMQIQKQFRLRDTGKDVWRRYPHYLS